jgi:hypothetical protein
MIGPRRPMQGISLHEGETNNGGNNVPRCQIDHDLRWSAIQAHQIGGRSHRDGKFAQVYWVIAKDTIDSRVAELLLWALEINGQSPRRFYYGVFVNHLCEAKGEQDGEASGNLRNMSLADSCFDFLSSIAKHRAAPGLWCGLSLRAWVCTLVIHLFWLPEGGYGQTGRTGKCIFNLRPGERSAGFKSCRSDNPAL